MRVQEMPLHGNFTNWKVFMNRKIHMPVSRVICPPICVKRCKFQVAFPEPSLPEPICAVLVGGKAPADGV